MYEVIALLVPWIVTTWVSFAVINWDERHLDPARRLRAWPATTKQIALLVFGVLAIPVHFGRTRRSVLGVLLGVACMIATAVPGVLVGALIEWIADK